MGKINWPEKKPVLINEYTGRIHMSWNEAIDACKSAEKEARLSVDEIILVMSEYYSGNRVKKIRKKIAQAIHVAVYGEEYTDGES